MSKYKLSDYIDIFINESEDLEPGVHKALVGGVDIPQKHVPTQIMNKVVSKEEAMRINSKVAKNNPRIKYYILMTLAGLASFTFSAYMLALVENSPQPSTPSKTTFEEVKKEKDRNVFTDENIEAFEDNVGFTTGNEKKLKSIKAQLKEMEIESKKIIRSKLIEKRKKFDLNKLYKHIKKIEGVKLVPYQDTNNQITVGIGNSFLFNTNLKDLPDDWHLDFYKRIGLSEGEALKRYKANKDKYKSSKSKEVLKLNKRIEKIEARHQKNYDYINGLSVSEEKKERKLAEYKKTIKKELKTIKNLKNIISDFDKYGNITDSDAKLGLENEIKKFGHRSIEEFGNEFNNFDVSIKTLIYDIYFNAGMYSFKNRKIKKGKKTAYIGFGKLKKAIIAYSNKNRFLDQGEDKESIRQIISLFKKVRKKVKDSSLSVDRKEAHINNINDAINFYIGHFNLPAGLIKENTLLDVYKELI